MWLNYHGYPTGAYPYGLLITLYSDASYATTQIYIADYSFNNGIYVRTKGGYDWSKLSGTKILAKK